MSVIEEPKPRVLVWPEGDLSRRVVLDGVEAVLVRRDGTWSVTDEERLASESRLLSALDQPYETLERARGVVAALNADLVRPDQLSALAQRLAWTRLRSPDRYGHLALDERDALAVACAHLGGDEVLDFLSWVLSKRLEWPLRRTPWVRPGWHHWTGHSGGGWEFDTTMEARLGAGFFDALAAHRDERFSDLAVFTDPAADPDRLAERAQGADDKMLDLVAVNPATPVETLKHLGCVDVVVSSIEEFRGRMRVLQNPSAPGWLVALAATAPIANRLENHPHYRCDTASAQRFWAVLHPRAPIRLLRELASCCYPRVRATVGRTERTPARVLELIAHSFSPHERAAVAANPAAPGHLLERLAADPRREVRATAAANRAACPEVLERLAADQVAAVRRAAAANRQTPPGVLRRLCEEPDMLIAAAAAGNPATQQTAMGVVAARLASARQRQARRVAAAMPDTPPRVLAGLAADPDAAVRIAVAQNTQAPAATLRRIAERAITERDRATLFALIGNPAVDGELRGLVAEGCIDTSGPPPQRFMTPADRRRWATRRPRSEPAAQP